MADQEVATAITQAFAPRDLDPGLLFPGSVAAKNGKTLGVMVGTDRRGRILIQVAGIAVVRVGERYVAGETVPARSSGKPLGVALSPSENGRVRVLLGANSMDSVAFDPVVPAAPRPPRKRRRRPVAAVDPLDNARVIRG